MIDKPLFRRTALAAWIACAVATAWVSLLPDVNLPVDFWNADKLYHMAAYVGLGGLPLLAFASRSRALAASYAAIFMGALLEWGQSFVPGREASMGDAVANAVGVFVGIALADALLARLRGRGRADGRE